MPIFLGIFADWRRGKKFKIIHKNGINFFRDYWRISYILIFTNKLIFKEACCVQYCCYSNRAQFISQVISSFIHTIHKTLSVAYLKI